MKPNSEVTQGVHQPSQYRQIHRQRHLLLTLTTISFMLICEASAAADQGAFYVNQWGSEGTWGYGATFNYKFKVPSGIAMDSSGYIYVADRGNNRIKKFTPDGEFELQWGVSGPGDGEFNNPQGIAVDSKGNVYVADEGNHRIQIFNSSGDFLQKLGGISPGTGNYEFNSPSGVAVRGYDVYVADTNNHRIQKFQIYRNFVHSYVGTLEGLNPGPGTANGQFDHPGGIALDSEGNVYVADTNNHRIQKFDKSNAYLEQWGGSEGSGNLQFSYPRGVAVDDNGAVYVVDWGNHRIKKYASTGLYIGRWGGSGEADGKFNNPTFVAVGKGCAIAVSDTDNHRVQKFACDNSNFLDEWGGGHASEADGQFNNPQGVTVDSSGYVYVADTGNHRIQKFTSEGKFVGKLGQHGAGDGEFDHPTSVAVDREGTIYVADRDNKRIQKFASDGTFLTKWSGGPNFGDPPLSCPTTVAVDVSLNVYVVDGGYKVLKFTKAGSFINSLGPNDGSNLGYLYPEGVLTETKNIAYDVLYVTSTGLGNPSQGIRKFRATKPYQPDYFYLGQQAGNFDGLAMDSEDNFYAFNHANHHIQKFTSSFSTFNPSTFVYFHEWGGPGVGMSQFNGPSGIAVDKNCNIYVADAGNHRIQKFSVLGSPSE